MKAIVIFNFCVAFLLTIVSNGVRAETDTEVLEKMAKRGQILDGIFKPSVNGSLGIGCYSTTYKGEFVPLHNMSVAMKFSSPNRITKSRKEFEFYTYLNATNDLNVVNNGIPAIYYYGKHNRFTIMAMTLLRNTGDFFDADQVTKVNVLVAFREFVRTIKYIHSHGIIHMGINTKNMIMQNGRCFIFNFGSSLDMNNNEHRENILRAKYDFKRFLEVMFALVKPRKNWHWLGLLPNKDAHRMGNITTFLDKLLEDAKTNEANNFTGLRRIFVEFAKHAFDNDSTSTKIANGTRIPFYDHLYQVIYEECEICGINSISSISSIPDPFRVKKWSRQNVDYELFEKRYADEIALARMNGFTCGCF